MRENRERTGRCLCGAVSLRATPEPHVGACHCGMCRRWGGGPAMVLDCGGDADFQGGEITRFRSSDWAERAFCKACGTHLYYRLLATGEYFVPAGAFDTNDFELTSQIYIDRKPGYYELANDTPKFTEQQVVDMYTAAASKRDGGG